MKILEIDEERRRLSLSIKRVEGQNMPLKDLGAAVQEAQAAAVEAAPSETPDLDLSEEVFAEPPPAADRRGSRLPDAKRRRCRAESEPTSTPPAEEAPEASEEETPEPEAADEAPEPEAAEQEAPSRGG